MTDAERGFVLLKQTPFLAPFWSVRVTSDQNIANIAIKYIKSAEHKISFPVYINTKIIAENDMICVYKQRAQTAKPVTAMPKAINGLPVKKKQRKQ